MVVMKRVSTAFVALALALAAAFFIMPGLNAITRGAVSGELERLRGRFESSLGLSLSFESLSPSILRAVSLSRISVKAPGGRIILSAQKVRVVYDIMNLIRGNRSDVISGLELADVKLDLRLPEDDELLARLGGLFSGSGGGSTPKLVISGRNVTAGIATKDWGSASFTARAVEFSTLEEEPVFTLDGRFSVAPKALDLGEIIGALTLSGSFSRDFGKARLGLSVSAESRDISLSTQRFELVYGDRELILTKVKDRAALDTALRLSLSGGESSLSLKLDGYSPSKSVRLSGRYSSIVPWMEIPYTGTLLLEAPGTDLSKMRYAIDLSGSLPHRLLGPKGGSTRALLRAKGDRAEVAVERALIERGEDRAEYSGNFRFSDLAPDGRLDLRLSLLDGSLGVVGSMHLVGHGGEYAAMADEVSVGGVIFKDVALAAARKERLVDFNLSFRPPSSEESTPAEGEGLNAALYSGEVGASSGLPLVRCEGSASFGEVPNLELSADFESVDLGACRPLLSALIASPDAIAALASLKLGGSLFATSDLKRLSWSVPDLTLVSTSFPGAYALLSLAGTTKNVSVKRFLVSSGGNSVEGSGKVDFSEPGRIDFETKLSLLDIPCAMKGSVVNGIVSITGDYDLALTAILTGPDRYISAKIRALPLPLGGNRFLANFEAKGRITSLEDWFITVSELDLVPMGEKMASMPEVKLSGDFSPDSADIRRLRVVDKVSALSGNAKLEYKLSAPFAASISASLTAEPAALPSSPAQAPGAKGNAIISSAAGVKEAVESYTLKLGYADGRLDGSVDLLASPLSRLGKLPIEGSADGRVSINGMLSRPDLDFSLRLRDGRFLDQTFVLDCSGSYSDDSLELRELSSAYQGQAISKGKARFSFADASASVSFDFLGTVGGESLACSFSANGAVAASAASPKDGKLAELFAHYAASGSLKAFSYGTVSADIWPFSIQIDSGSVSIAGGSQGELRCKYAPGGFLSASLRPPFPITADFSGLFDGKNMDLSVRNIEFGLDLLEPLMPENVVRITSGKARGGFRALGLVGDPEITGEIDLVGASVKVPGWLSDDIGPFDAPIVALGRKVSAFVPSAPAGKAALALSCQATFDHWLPTGLTASVKTLERSSIRLDSVIQGVHATGDAAADVRFALQGDVLAIDADVTLKKASVVVSPETLAGSSGSSSRPSLFIAVSANVHFGRGVQVYFPSSSLPVVTGYSDPSSVLAIKYNQDTEDFSMKGTVTMRGGEVFYIQRNFFLKSGTIVFNENRDRFDPRVTLLAQLRDRDDEGTAVTITLRADNASIATFKPILSSDPVMTEAEIAVLMGQNLFGTSTDSSLDIRKAVVSGTDFIPQLNVTRSVENKVRSLFGLDMLYLRTHVLQKWLIDLSGWSTSEGDALGRYLDQSELYAGKYLSDSIFAHASLSFREDPLAAYHTPELDSEFGVELDTPFGLIQWNVTPTDFQSLLISDQSLGLSWKFSY
jgi:translocation and assembly module TamB